MLYRRLFACLFLFCALLFASHPPSVQAQDQAEAMLTVVVKPLEPFVMGPAEEA